jgi:pimeloyl-ACP methyl ester carboxylesterase
MRQPQHGDHRHAGKWQVAALLLSEVVCIGGSGCDDSPTPGRLAKDGVLVVIIHGTWGGESEWPKVVDGKATFGSEVLRGLDGRGEIYPFLWASSIFHEKREEAIDNLVKIIEEKGRGFDRICLIGHSHGGNVAMLAAGRCRQRIATVVCLSTPHVYLCTIDDEQKERYLPVYCPPASLANIDRIISLWPHTDSVPSELSNALLRGLSENDALDLTHHWRKQFNHPRLPEDSFLARALERFNEVIGVPLFESGNIVSAPKLVIPGTRNERTTNIGYNSLVADPIQSHRAVHSRRVGYLVGRILQRGLTKEAERYVRTFAQPLDTDAGEPMALKQHEQWLAENRTAFKRIGWQLKDVEIRLLPEATRVANDASGSQPDPFLRLRVDGGAPRHGCRRFETSFHEDTDHARWRPRIVLFEGDRLSLQVVDFDVSTVLGQFDPSEEILGAVNIEAKPPLVTEVAAQPTRGRYWSANLEWTEAHH